MIVSDAPDETEAERRFHAAIAAERKADRFGAVMFASACQAGDVDALLDAVDFLNDNTISGWRLAMRRVIGLPP